MAKNHELAEKDYILGMSYKDIADKYKVTIDTVKSWKTRYKWERDKAPKTVKKNAHNAHINKKVCKSVQKNEPEKDLSDQEKLFCYHYVRTWNAMQSAIFAGYSKHKPTAKVQGCVMLKRPHIKAEIDRLAELFRQDIHVDIQDLLAFCMKVIGADIGDYLKFGAVDRLVYDADGPVKDPDTGEYLKEPVNCISLGESEELDTSVIQEVKQGKDGISIKLADKKWAWEQIIKYFDWLPDKWKRKFETEKLKLEKAKLLLEVEKAKGENKENQHVDALRRKIAERKKKNETS